MRSRTEAMATGLDRRRFLAAGGIGLGQIALAGLLNGGRAARAASGPFDVRPPHFAPKARAVIHLFMAGAPSQLDLFDHKPTLAAYQGKPIPPEVIGGQRYAFIRSDAAALGPQFKFAKHGESGAEISEVMPHLAKVVDDICIIRSTHTSQFNHAPAQIFFNSGFAQPGRPSIGSWVTYGLGAETTELPAFVVMSTGRGISGGAANWSSGFLPSVYTGVRLRNEGDPILNVSNPEGIDARAQRESLDLIGSLNRRHLAEMGDPEIATRLSSYEMAFRLQTSAPELMDLAGETRATRTLYGIDEQRTDAFGHQCLVARRLVERGVRVVTICVGGRRGWDQHGNLRSSVQHNASVIDAGMAGLIRDLKGRGLLDSTLLMWGGEFGRTPYAQGVDGRDHFAKGFTYWLAGGGVKRGIYFGETDETGMSITKDPVHFNDLHATILHLMGLDPERLTFRYAGRDQRLTNVHGRVVRGILA